MTKLKSTLIKLCSLVFAVCAAFAIATIPQAETVDAAAEESSFKVNGTSIRAYDGENEGKVGLRFEAKFNDAWLSTHEADKYTFGMIISPTALFDEVDDNVWSDDKNPTQNMEAVDGVNIIRIQNSAVAQGQEFYASILFDDESLKATIAEKTGNAATDDQLNALKEHIFTQSYSAVAYVTYKNADGDDECYYSDRYATTMRETAAKTYAVGVAEGNADYKALALTYLKLDDDDVAEQSAYVAADKKVVVDSAENYKANESTMIVADGKVLKLDTDYTLVDGDIVLTATKESRTVENVVVIDDTMLNEVEVTYVDRALSSPEDVREYFMLDYWDTTWGTSRKPASGTPINDLAVVLTQDVDMSGMTLSNYNTLNFNGYFDGRGHVISDITVSVQNGSARGFGIFGGMQADAVIKNVAFDNICAINTNNNGSIFSNTFMGLVENVYFSYSPENKHLQGLFLYLRGGTLRNVVIADNYYDLDYTLEDYIDKNKSKYGVSPLSRIMHEGGTSSTYKYENVQVISRRPLVYFSEDGSNTDVTYNNNGVLDNPDTPDVNEAKPATINKWGDYYVYAENETEVWYDFDYFYRSKTADPTKPGLGLEAGTATVKNTLSTGKTHQYKGVRRYDDVAKMMEDSNNKDNVNALIATGMWEEVNGQLVWANNENIAKQVVNVNGAVEYDASTGKLNTTVFNGEEITKITLNGVELTDGENGNGGLVRDGAGKIVGIRAKLSATDELPGIEYRYNNKNTSNIISYDDTLIIETATKVYSIRKIDYWTKIIYNKDDLREAMGYDVDYTLKTNTNGTIVNSDRVDTPRTLVVDSRLANYYYEGVFNVGLYKLANDVNMEEAGIGYEKPLATETPTSGGFAALLDGKGYSIKNFKPDANGLVGVMNSYTHQYQLDGTTRTVPCYPTVRNIAFENVITSQAIPIIARTAGYPDVYEGNAPRIENIYVTVSSQSTGSAGIINTVNAYVTTNNVYIVDNNEYASQFIDDGMYKFTDRNGAVTIPEGKVYNPMADAKNNSLFGKIGADNADKIKNSVARTTNVYVVSKLPLMYHNSTTKYMHAYLIVINKTQKTIGLSLGYLGGAAPSYVRAYGYGANETVAFIPAIYAIRGNVSTAFTDNYDTANLAKKETYSYAGWYCDKCYETTFTFATPTSKAGDSCCFDEECGGNGGKLVKVAAPNGFFNSPIAYEWTLHNLETEAGTDYKTTNGTFRFPGAYRYDDVESLKAVAYDYSSFTGATGNGLWEVVETDDGEGNTLRELKWVGAKA